MSQRPDGPDYVVAILVGLGAGALVGLTLVQALVLGLLPGQFP